MVVSNNTLYHFIFARGINVRLYHGSKERVIENFKIIARDKNPPEFGDGVYLTANLEYAKERSCMHSNSGAVYAFDVDLEKLDGIRLKDSMSEIDNLFYYTAYLNRVDLRDVAVDCLDKLDGKDYIFGDMIKHTKEFVKNAEEFNSGNMELKEFIQKTDTFEKYEQYCFRTQKAIDALNAGLISVMYTQKSHNKVIVERTEHIKAL